VTAAPYRGAAGARQALPQLAALESALSDPGRLVRVLADADDRDAAVTALEGAFGLTPEQAEIVLDSQFGGLVRSRRATLTEELRVLRAPWGPPQELALQSRGRLAAVVVLDGAEHAFRAPSRNALLDEVTRFLWNEVAVPQLRPVFLSTDLTDGPGRLLIWPSRVTEFEYADDLP
jgi:hypothetical protein